MKTRIYSVALTALLATGLAFAAPQDGGQGPTPSPDAGQGSQGPRRPPDPSRQVKMLAKRLNLTSDQQKQILPILTDRQQQFASIRNDSSLSPNDRREKMRTLREDSETKIKAVLTDSQKATYEQMQQQMRERMQQRRGEQNSESGQSPNGPAAN